MEYVGQFFIKKKRTSSNQTGKMLPRRLPGSGLVYIKIKAKYSKLMANPPFAVLYPLPASWPLSSQFLPPKEEEAYNRLISGIAMF